MHGSLTFSVDGYAILSSGVEASAGLVLGVALSGKYYVEVRVDASVSASAWVFGFCGDAVERTSFPANASSASASGWHVAGGCVLVNVGAHVSVSVGGTIGLFVDVDVGSVRLYYDGRLHASLSGSARSSSALPSTKRARLAFMRGSVSEW